MARPPEIDANDPMRTLLHMNNEDVLKICCLGWLHFRVLQHGIGP